MRSVIADFHNLVALAAARGRDLDRIASALADDGARDGRGHRYHALLHIGLELTDNLIDGLVLGSLVDERDPSAELYGVARQFRNVDHLGAADLVLELGDPSFGPALLLFSGMIFRILRQIAMRARFLDGPNDARALHRF